MWGLLEYYLGHQLNKVMIKHEPILRKHFKENLGIDILKTIKEKKVSILEFDNHFTAPAFGYKDKDDYYYKSSPSHRVPNIAIPTMSL